MFQAYAYLFAYRFKNRSTLGKGLNIGLSGRGATPGVTRKDVREKSTTDHPH